MPASLVQDNQGRVFRRRLDRLGKGRRSNGWKQAPIHPSGSRLDEPGNPEPLVAGTDRHHWPLPIGTPDPKQDRLQARAMFVLRQGARASAVWERSISTTRSRRLMGTSLERQSRFGMGRSGNLERRAQASRPDPTLMATDPTLQALK